MAAKQIVIFLAVLTASLSLCQTPSQVEKGTIHLVVPNQAFDRNGKNFNILVLDDKTTIQTPYNGKEIVCTAGKHTLCLVRWGGSLTGSGKPPAPFQFTIEANQCKDILIAFPSTIQGTITFSERSCKQ